MSKKFDIAHRMPECLSPYVKSRRFVVWGASLDPENPKRPYTPLPLESMGKPSAASASNPQSWGSYDEALATAERLDCGIGIMLGPADDDFDLAAFDLDDCRDPTSGALSAWAEELVRAAQSYAEVTPSGCGLRIIGRASKGLSVQFTLTRPDNGKVEVYAYCNRYITITGNCLPGTPETLSDLTDLLKQHHREHEAKSLRSAVSDSRDDRVAQWIRELDHPGKWHNAMVPLVAHFVAKGESDSAIQAIARSWTQPGYKPEETRKEVAVAIEGARRKGYDRGAASEEPALQTNTDLQYYLIDDLLSEPPPRMLIEDIFPERGVAVVAGASGSMKTFLMISLSLSVALGLSVAGRSVMQGEVLYMLNEGQAGFGQRCDAWLQQQKQRRPANFRIAKMTPNLARDGDLGPFIGLAEELGIRPSMIVIDTFSKATIGADDNSTSEMAGVIENAYRLANHFEALVVLIDHIGKDAKKGLRGAYAKYANSDMVGMVTKADRVALKTVKQKEAEDNLRLEFRIEKLELKLSDGSFKTFPVLVPVSDNVLPAQKDFIIQMLMENGRMPRSELVDAFVGLYGDTTKRSFNVQLGRLKRSGVVVIEGEYVLLTERD